MKKLLLFIAAIFILVSCSQSINSDLQENDDEVQQRKDEIIRYMLCDDCTVPEDEILSDINFDLNAISESSNTETADVTVSYNSKSLKSQFSKIEKSQNQKKFKPNMSVDVTSFKSKSDLSDTDTSDSSIVLTEYKVYNDDGTVQVCVTSNDRR